MFRYAIIFFILSLIVGLTNISVWFKRIAMVFFALFFLGFLALLGFAYLLGEAFEAGARPGMIVPLPMLARLSASKLIHKIV